MEYSNYQSFLSFGDELISQTRELVLSLWKQDRIQADLKADATPVSEIDLRCEEFVRTRILEHFPHHGVIGEEFGSENEDAEFVWTIDPIDGTQNLINRIPTFATILGVMYRRRPVFGWIDHPVLGESLRGGVGVGTFHNGRRVFLDDNLETLTPKDIIGANCPATFEQGGHLEVLWKILKFHPHVRMYYDAYAHTLSVLGSLAVMVEYNVKVWDISATQALIEGAGGVYRQLGRDLDAKPHTLYHAAFGKKRAVELISEAILGGC
ncbi:inositol monophosphatase family protein [Okeania sp. KiyG1]|uniref:inositol monophosphatase family protein n=1 Tax=Okeania sp. KiyG1 TaxID=2720165 RepID=UPI001F314CE2|nr:inositol monophosphatase family protein [Okeania sp. KiyG1]